MGIDGACINKNLCVGAYVFFSITQMDMRFFNTDVGFFQTVTSVFPAKTKMFDPFIVIGTCYSFSD